MKAVFFPLVPIYPHGLDAWSGPEFESSDFLLVGGGEEKRVICPITRIYLLGTRKK